MALFVKFYKSSRLIPAFKNAPIFNSHLPFPKTIQGQERGFRKAYGLFLRVMKARRKLAGPDRIRKRSEWDNWNYGAEIYAFPKRLQENISEATLKTAFTHQSYIESEEKWRKELDVPVDSIALDLKPNTELVDQGFKIMTGYLDKFLIYSFPYVPEEGKRALRDYLLSDEVLSHVSSNIGTTDLIFCSEYPPSNSTLAKTLKAIIGAIAIDNNVSRAENFVLDFICPQLIGKDVFEIWDLQDPIKVLNDILKRHNRAPTESRLIFESGRNTIEAIYHVGIYSNKEFLGRGPGETIAIAEEMAAYDALRKLFHLNENEKALALGNDARDLPFSNILENPPIAEWKSKTLNSEANI